MKVKFSGWPWQSRGEFWANPNGTTGKPWGWKLDCGGMGRFGGGWQFKLGVIGSMHMNPWRGEVVIDLVYGSMRVSWGCDKSTVKEK